MEGAPPVANQIDLFMHFLGASRDGLVARRVDLDTISSSEGENFEDLFLTILFFFNFNKNFGPRYQHQMHQINVTR
jgi:hypothetical protein